ncbi:hypothetical protein Cpir12675_004862 [Ceratocystis pirilliformis]|uniref:C2H2-type domain-containing protein n=1 Tax=Ceratocystis pirilliformis TaxID=259994 RepID=A0ABR3YTQ3_9PEZI
MPKRKAEEVEEVLPNGNGDANSEALSAAALISQEAPGSQQQAETVEATMKVENQDLEVLPPPAKRSRSSRPKVTAPISDASSSDEEYESDVSDCSDFSTDSGPSRPSTSCDSPAPKIRVRPKNQICKWPGCTKRYNRPARLESHMRSHTGERPFACVFPGCDKTYIEAKHLAQHVEGKHEGKRNHKCFYADCGRAFFTSTRLSRHVNSHIKAEQFKCKGYNDCKQVFRRRDTLNRHVRQVHLNLPGYTCPEKDCPKAFSSSGALRNHRRRMHGELKHFCDECKITVDGQVRSLGFTTVSELRAHFKTAHMTCSFCTYRCTYPSEMDRHVSIHHSAQTVIDRKTVACPWPGCEKKFTKRSNLNTHIKSSHDGYRFVCGLIDLSTCDGLADWDNANGCHEGFVTKANLESHIRHVHLGLQRTSTAIGKPKNLVEELAGADDAQKRTLLCGCGRGFIRYHDLQVHVELDHGGDSQEVGYTYTQETGQGHSQQHPLSFKMGLGSGVPSALPYSNSIDQHGLPLPPQTTKPSLYPVDPIALNPGQATGQTDSSSSPAYASGMPLIPMSMQHQNLGFQSAFVSPALTPQTHQSFGSNQHMDGLSYGSEGPGPETMGMAMGLDLSQVIDTSLSSTYPPEMSAVPTAETAEAATV